MAAFETSQLSNEIAGLTWVVVEVTWSVILSKKVKFDCDKDFLSEAFYVDVIIIYASSISIKVN